MATKLFVGSLPFSMTSDELKDLFTNANVGTVQSATVVTDKFTGKSRGFGFVEMSTPEETQNAISALNGTEVSGRAIVVNEARPMQDRKPGFSRGGGGQRSDYSRGGYRSGGYRDQ